MGFGAEEATTALWKTGGSGGIQPAIDAILAARDVLSGNVAPSSGVPPATATPAPAPRPAPAPPSQAQAAPSAAVAGSPSVVKSSFDLAARDNHARKEQEDRTKQVRAEQKAKKEAQLKIKQQIAEDNIIRRLTQTIRKADTLASEDLERAREEIATFLSTSRPCDELSTMRDQLANVIESRNGGTVAPAAAAPAAASA
eukprot:CAMPEP_0173398244 /NCGR_PEP_ID=MMETSP1356-20130122/40946_1 /TAXON_ID=77927 ORGANISM="Hemiselmis virescens, Strain PCC157" /NCGR_SAMPLE_ID=MMETSP1356 /ASSEMBLY_ACC=CAM_ASM_000847 /LENGTH=198 /DNA_ID=CAMNT_0014357695 /DNA_START=51 /DNA_END=644 /DNA_ORIENTATION=-